MEGIHKESPWCAPTLLIQCRLHKTKKHTTEWILNHQQVLLQLLEDGEGLGDAELHLDAHSPYGKAEECCGVTVYRLRTSADYSREDFN